MTRPLIYLPAVRNDLLEAFSYYESCSPGHGAERFELAFRHGLNKIREGLVTHLRVFDHYHRVPLGKYPYNLYYRLRKERAVIVGVLYARMDPDRIEATLTHRED